MFWYWYLVFMFQLNSTRWFEWEAWELTESTGQNSAMIIPEYGGILNRLTLHGNPVLAGYKNDVEAKALYYYKGAWLFPFANRLQHGRWDWNGREYQWPINDISHGHALHGGMAKQPFKVGSSQVSESSASITVIHQSTEGLGTAYPFPFELTITYTLGQGTLSVDIQIHNIGATMLPYQLGWHPYFMVPGDLASWELHLPPTSKAVLQSDFMPTGHWEQLEETMPMILEQSHLDLCLRNDLAAPDTCVQVAGQTATLVYEQRGFDYIMLFTPSEWRTALAIEPMTGAINCLNTGEGLLQLAPGSKQAHQVVLTILPGHI